MLRKIQSIDFKQSIFRMYDVDENGMIDLNEMTRLVKSIFKVSQSKVIGSLPPSLPLYLLYNIGEKSLETYYEEKIITKVFIKTILKW